MAGKGDRGERQDHDWDLYHPNLPDEPLHGEEVLVLCLPTSAHRGTKPPDGFTVEPMPELPAAMKARLEFQTTSGLGGGGDSSRRGGAWPKGKAKAKAKAKARSVSPRSSKAKGTAESKPKVPKPKVRSRDPNDRDEVIPGLVQPFPGENHNEWRKRARQALVLGASAEGTTQHRRTAWD